jgi:hypothetical protein
VGGRRREDNRTQARECQENSSLHEPTLYADRCEWWSCRPNERSES